MKRFSTLFSMALLVFAALLFSNYSGNPPNGKTGAPGESTCAQCHGGNASYQGNIQISGIPDTIAPLTTYSVTVTLTSTSGTPAKGGFQLVALNSANENAGTITTTDGQTGTDVDAGRTYIEHRPAKSFSNNMVTYTFDWESPNADQDDDITMYFVGNFANGNSSSTGDKVITNTFSTHLNTTISGTENLFAAEDIDIFPNPSTGLLTIKRNNQDGNNLKWAIFNINGNKIADGNEAKIDLTHQAKGIYLARITSGEKTITKKIILE